jgi:hypothetical protein
VLTGLASALVGASYEYSARAARLWSAAATHDTVHVGIPFGVSPLSLPKLDHAALVAAQARARRMLGDAVFDAAFAAGQALTLDQAVEETIVWLQLLAQTNSDAR